ncbi:MAG: hypothetical protein P9F75_08820 [Candidatus Contendobacter sp.]|nr:hypothetical protein [Candidatus Contendobacter sp.]
MTNPLKKFLFPNQELEAQLAEVSVAMQGEFRALHASHAAIIEETRAIADAPPARVDLVAFLVGFIDRVLTDEPGSHRLKLQEQLERLRRNPGESEDVMRRWADSYKSGLDDFNWLFVPLLGETLKANAAKLAESLPWPDPGLPAAERAEKVRALERQAAALIGDIDAIRDRAARLNIVLGE